MTLKTTEAKRAALVGAFARFNYGDLLFPLVVGNELAAHSPSTDKQVYAMADSDLRRYGAAKTQALRRLYAPGALRAGDMVMFAGGGTIGVDWTYMHSNLLGRTGNAALYYLKRLIGERRANAWSRRRFGARAPFPWVAGTEDFLVPVHVAYNAVGGSEFSRLAPDVQALTLQRLRQASYMSVRDTASQRLFEPVQAQVPVHLAPDSAMLMSEPYPLPWLQSQLSDDVRQLIEGGPYVCFQSNIHYAAAHQQQLVQVLKALHDTHGLRALLLPIGRYVGLDDHAALRHVMAGLQTPAAVVSPEATLWDIMAVIAHASLFLGTSLHGNITAQSFAVPHLGLGAPERKVDYYLRTWALPGQDRTLPLPEVPERARAALAVPEAARQAQRADQIALSHRNFEKMAAACGLPWQ